MNTTATSTDYEVFNRAQALRGALDALGFVEETESSTNWLTGAYLIIAKISEVCPSSDELRALEDTANHYGAKLSPDAGDAQIYAFEFEG